MVSLEAGFFSDACDRRPFVTGELSLPTVSSIVTPDESGERDNEQSIEIHA
jgi:hypothetical protein